MADKKQQIERLKKTFKEVLVQEWKDQGHDLTGEFVQQLEIRVEELAGSLKLEAWILKYGAYLEFGVKPGRIPYQRGSGAGNSLYISGLIDYVQKRMNIRSISEAKSVAFAIAETHKKKGMPTPASSRFSKSGQRTNWITAAMVENKDLIIQLAREYARTTVEVQLSHILAKWQKQFKTTA